MSTIIKGDKIKFYGFLSIDEDQVFQIVNVTPNDDGVKLELVEVEE